MPVRGLSPRDAPCDLKWLQSVNFCQSLFPIVFWCFFLRKTLAGKASSFLGLFILSDARD